VIIKAVIFDLDGVLVDACNIHYQALNAALRNLVGYEIPRDEHESVYNGLPTKEKLKILVEKQIIREDQTAEINNMKQSITMYFIEGLQLDEQKIELIRWLKSKGKIIGCVTNCTRSSAVKMLKLVGIYDYMSHLICSDDGYRPKPAPDGYTECMKRLKVDVDEVMVIEDSSKGIESAMRAGVRLIKAINKGPKEVTKDIFKGYI